MAQRGEKRDARHKRFVNENPVIKKNRVRAVGVYVETAKWKLCAAAHTLREIKESDLADTARRLAAEVGRFERRLEGLK